MNNPKGETPIPLSTFGGLSTELSPVDIPEGGSPDNQDVAFIPGSVTTRPGLSRVTGPSDATPEVYHTSLQRQDGTVINVRLHASGHIWVEDFTNNPGVFINVMDVTAGSRCTSRVAGGKLWMAFNDGRHGSDIPRWFDGSKWGRVSQSGPCNNPSFVETIAPSSSLAAVGSGVTVGVVSAVTANPYTVTEQYWVNDDYY